MLQTLLFFFFGTCKSFDVSSLFPVEKAVAIIVQFLNTPTLYYFLVFFFYLTVKKQ